MAPSSGVECGKMEGMLISQVLYLEGRWRTGEACPAFVSACCFLKPLITGSFAASRRWSSRAFRDAANKRRNLL
jgi:hypothetical protein